MAATTQFLRLPQVKDRTGLSRSEIYRRAAKGPDAFPQPVRLGRRCTVWASDEVDAWIQARVASSRKAAA
jgi:prophage regulatory protein